MTLKQKELFCCQFSARTKTLEMKHSVGTQRRFNGPGLIHKIAGSLFMNEPAVVCVTRLACVVWLQRLELRLTTVVICSPPYTEPLLVCDQTSRMFVLSL